MAGAWRNRRLLALSHRFARRRDKAWRFDENVIDGILENSEDGGVTGHVRLARAVADDQDSRVIVMDAHELKLAFDGDLPGEYVGTVVCVRNPNPCHDAPHMRDWLLPRDPELRPPAHPRATWATATRSPPSTTRGLRAPDSKASGSSDSRWGKHRRRRDS